MSNDLSNLWIRDEIIKQIGMRDKLLKAYTSAKNKDTGYIRGIARMLQVREKIIQLLSKES